MLALVLTCVKTILQGDCLSKTQTSPQALTRRCAIQSHSLARMPGGGGVTNKIAVYTLVEPQRVQFLIKDVLELRADREANRIKVKVDEGALTSTRSVKLWDEKKVILRASSHAPGVRTVHGPLFIDPYDARFEAARANWRLRITGIRYSLERRPSRAALPREGP